MPAQQKLMDHLFVKVDGQDLPPAVMNDLIEVTVDSSLHLPDMFTLHIHDEALKWLDTDALPLGKEVEISALPEAGGASQVLMKGEITALEPDFGDGTQATLLVRGYARSHRLHRTDRTEAYLQVTDSDLAKRLAGEAGLRAQVDDTTEVYDHIFRHNQTPMSFLTERAQRIGYECYVQDRTLYFHKPSADGSALELEWGVGLRRFAPRLTLAEQVDEVIVRGWDAKTRQVIVGRATQGKAEPQIGQNQHGAQLATAAFDSARRVVVSRPVNSQAEADTMAQAVCDELSGAFIEAEGECVGQPALRAGKVVNLTALGQRLGGAYFVTSATHVYRAGVGYTTRFNVNGRRPETLYNLLEQAVERRPGAVNRMGPVIGIVTNNKDPEDRGRVKVKFPWLSEDAESNWARVVGAGAGSQRGFYCLPEINDEVLVIFEHGDINWPYVLGGLWNGQDAPPLPASQALDNGQVRQRTFTTRAGHKLTFTDENSAGVVLQTAGGHSLTLADDDKKIVLKTPNGLSLTLDDGGQAISIESPGSLTIKSMSSMTLEASGSLAINGATVNINRGALEVT
jgi:phage protein D/phage baseplate assembly protein gpV